MVKIIFLSVVLINFVFFFLQYRKGAPEIYLPPDYETSTGSASHTQKIRLLSEISAVEPLGAKASSISDVRTQQPEAPSVAKVANKALINVSTPLVDTNNESIKTTDSHGSPQELKLPVVACYQLKKGEYTPNMFTHEMGESAFKLELFKQQQEDSNKYLVLTLAANSFQEAVGWEQEIKQQGIDDLWLFKQGQFKWRISLGIFTGKEQANIAREGFAKQTKLALEVVSGNQDSSVTYVKISAQEEQNMVAFEQKYSMYFVRKIECRKDILSGSHALHEKP
ncbi:MAG: hypothetical protein GQ529_05395 [Methyloprofundus sp.]|nr:hypothetical protein [Methyloprofundus sp.]